MRVWVIFAKSESGDLWGPWVFERKPSDDELETIFRDECSAEWDGDDGPGFRGSYLHIVSYGNTRVR